MKKRILALLLALVLTLGMLPTAFAVDADEPAEGMTETEVEKPAEGENEEMPEAPEEPEQPGEPEEVGEAEEAGAEEEAKAEAEAASLAADASGTVAYLMGKRLENGYYTANKAEVGHYTEKPDSLKNYLFYEDGVLTVFGGIKAGNSGTEDWKAVLSVESGSLTIKGSGILKLNGTGMSGLYVDRNHADINIDLTPRGSSEQLSITSKNACAVRGDLTITNAAVVTITTDVDKKADTTVMCDTIDGGAWIHASTVSIYNRVGGSCVNGVLRARAKQVTVKNQSADKATLNGDWNQLVVDRLTLTNAYGAVAVGGVSINVYSENKTGSYMISGCTPNGVPVIHGDVYAEGGHLSLGNRRTSADTYKSDGPVLIGNLKLENGTGLSVGRSMGKTDNAAEAMIQGNIELINCRIYNDNESHFTISRSRGDGAAVDGNITLRNSQLYVNAAYFKVLSSKPDSGAANQPTTGVRNCTLTLENSHFTFRGYSEWEDLVFDEDYQWYAGNYVQNVPAYKRSSEEQLTAEAFTNAYYVDIYTGDKAGKATVHDASFTESKTIDGFASWPMSFDVTVQMTGDTLNLQEIDGYKELYDSYEKGEKITHYGVDSSVDLAEYFDIVAPGGYPWKITAVDFLEQGATELNLRISGTPEYVSDLYFFMDIRGKLLGSGHDLSVNDSKQITWNIQLMPSGELDYDNIRTAAEFAEAIGGENYAEVSETTNLVTLRKNAQIPRDITMTGNFTIDVNGCVLSDNGYALDGKAILRSANGTQKIVSSVPMPGSALYGVYGIIEVSGGTLTLEDAWVPVVRMESGALRTDGANMTNIYVRDGEVELQNSTLVYANIGGGEVSLNGVTFSKAPGATNLDVAGGNVTIGTGTEVPCIVRVTGGELTINDGIFYGYEGNWLQQEGGTVNISGNGRFDGTMLITKGNLNIHGGEFTGIGAENVCLYQGGGNVTIENAALNAIASINSEGLPLIQHSIYMDGGSLRVQNAQIDGTIVINNRSEVELENSTVKTGTASAIVQNGGTLNITDCEVRGRNVAMVIEDKTASATLTSGTVTGGAWGVWVSDGGSFTMLDGTVQGSLRGIWVSEARTKLIVKGGSVISDEVALYVEKGSSIQLSGGTFTGDKNAIFAENGTMKGWLASGCEMSGDAIPGGFDPNKASATDAGTVTIEPESNEAAERVIELIDAIGEVEPNDDCKNKIDNAQAAYDALSAAQQKKVTNYKTLVNARATYDKLMADLTYVEQANEVNDLMAKVPENTDEIEKDDLAAIERAEAAYNAVAKDKNVKKYLDNNLVKHLKSARKAYDKSVKSAQKVQAMIEKLPEDAGKLDVSKDRKSVEKANAALDKLTRAQRTFLEAGAEDKLAACTARMTILTSCEKVIKDAQTAIKKLPAWNKIKATDENKVKAAEDAMAELENTAQEMGIQLTVGEGNEEKYSASTRAYYDFKDAAEDYRKAHLAPLADCEADSEHEQAIAEACAAYKNLGSDFPEANVTKNVQSFITKAEQAMLKNLEKLLNKNKKAALKVTKLIEKLLDYNTPFDSKQAKAIDAAWKAYEKLGSDAVRSFVEHADTLTELYYQLHEELRPRVWSVIDSAYIAHEEGNAVLNAWVVDFGAKTTKSTVKNLSSTDLNEYYDDTDIAINPSLNAAAAKNFAYELATALKNLPNSEYSRDFNSLYDHLFKITTDRDGVLSIKVGSSNGAALNWAFGIHPYQLAQAKAEGKTVNMDDYTIKVGNGKPYLEITDDGQYSNASITPDENDKDIALSSETKFLVHNMDGTYCVYTGYKNVPSLIAHYAEVVFDADYINELVAEIVYLTNNVYVTGNKVIAYVGKGADRSSVEVIDGELYYSLNIWVGDRERSIYVAESDMTQYFAEKFEAGFYSLRLIVVDGVKTAKVQIAPGGFENKFLNQPFDVLNFNEITIKIGANTFALADNCALYGIRDGKVKELTASDIYALDSTHQAYVDFLNDQETVAAIYMILADDD